jgi:O-antigen ligase
LGVLTLSRRLVRKWQGDPEPLLGAAPAWFFALFLFVCLASIPGSLDPVLGVKEWARLASGLAIYLMVADTVHDERGARRFLVVILLSSLPPLIIALLQRLAGGGYFFIGFVGTQFAHRPQGTFAHPATLGSYLVILLTLGMAVYFSSAKRHSALLLWAGVAGTCLVLTLARTQWLGMMVAVLVVGLLKRRRLALIALVVVLLLFAAVPLLRERLVASDSVGWRLDLWRAATNLAWPPTLLGRGLATSPWHIGLFLPNVESPPHNDYLKMVIEMGVLGFLTYLIWLLSLVWHAWRASRCATIRAITWRALALLAITLAGAVMSLTDNYLGYTAVQWYLWALVALVPIGGSWADAHIGGVARQPLPQSRGTQRHDRAGSAGSLVACLILAYDQKTTHWRGYRRDQVLPIGSTVIRARL